MPRMRGGYCPSGFDGRDIKWSRSLISESSVQLTRPPIKDQGNEIDSCTSMALCSAFEIVDAVDGNFSLLSPLFNYYCSRRDPRYYGPVALRTALGEASIYGICRKHFYDVPPTPVDAAKRPSNQAFADALEHRLLAYDSNTGQAGYYSLDGPNRLLNWRSVLSSGLPVIVGFWTQHSYWKGQGMLVSEPERNLGAHAVCIVGFDDTNKVFNVLDSRGHSFATDGEWFMAYEILESGRIIESWTIRTLSYNY